MYDLLKLIEILDLVHTKNFFKYLWVDINSLADNHENIHKRIKEVNECYVK